MSLGGTAHPPGRSPNKTYTPPHYPLAQYAGLRIVEGMNNATAAKYAAIEPTVISAGASAHVVKIGPSAVEDLLISGSSVNVLRAVAALGFSRTNRREIPANALFGERVRYDLSDVDGRVVGYALLTKDGGSATVWNAFAKTPECMA